MWIIQPVVSYLYGGFYAHRLWSLVLFFLFAGVSMHAQVSLTLGVKEPCPGLANASVTAYASGGTSPYRFSWSTGATGAVLSGVRSGTYRVTATDALGLSATATTTIVEPLPFRLDFEQSSCSEPFSLTAVGDGGTQPFSYYWNTGARTATISNLSSGTYCVTLTDVNNCGIHDCFTVNTGNMALAMSSTAASCFGTNDGSARVVVSGGVSPHSYRWSNGSTSAVITGLSGGTYRVTVTDSGGCTAIGSTVVAQPATMSVSITGSSVLCAGETGSLSATASGGTAPLSYRWSNGRTGSIITGISAGTYTVTVTDAAGCTAVSSPRTIAASTLVGADIQGDEVVCGTDGTTTLRVIPQGGQDPFTFNWSTGASDQVIGDIGAGTYGVTITDGIGCSVSESITITATEIDLVFTQSDVSCFGEGNGTVSVRPLGGVEPYLYNWAHTSENTPALTGLSGGIYYLTVIDNTGCMTAGQIDVFEPQSMNISFSKPESFLCYGETDGWLQANVSGGNPPYRYRWNTPEGDQTSTVSGLPAGIYDLTVIDGSDCTVTGSATITQYSPIEIYVQSEEVICGGTAESSTGDASLVVTGGNGPYEFAWSTGATAESETGLGSGTYTVTVTDQTGCTAETTFSIETTEAIEIYASVRESLCQGESNGSIKLDIRKGTPPFTIKWNTGDTGPELTELGPGLYSFTVTDNAGCTAAEVIQLTEPEALLLDIQIIDVSCFGARDGAARILGTGGTGPYSYYWSTGDSTDTVTDLPAGVYTVEVTDFNDCSAVTETILINEPAELTIDVLSNPVACAGESNGQLTVQVSGGTPGYDIQWSTGATGPVLTNIPSGFYSLTVTDANNCVLEVYSLEQAEADSLSITFDVTNIECDNNDIGAINALIAGGTMPYSYFWSNGETTPNISGLAPGMYALTVTDSILCTVIDSVEVLGTPELIIGASPTYVSCFGGSDGEIALNFTSGNPPYSILWSTGSTDSVITGLTAGSYGVTVTNDDGCDAIIPVINITEPAQLAVSLGIALNPACFGDSTGTISPIITGGTAPYTYNWSSGQTTSDITGLPAGTYDLTVTDRNDCTVTNQFTLSEPAELVLLAGELSATCAGDNNGSARATVIGGVPPFQIDWSNGASGEQADNLSAGVYSLTVTDNNDCTATTTVTINSFDQPVCEIVVLQPVIMGSDGELEVQVTGGTAPFDYLWNTGDTTALLSNLDAGTYSATVTDANGCMSFCSVNLDAMSAVGDFVWEDENKNGVQDAGEAGVAGVVVTLKDDQGIALATDTTDAMGEYLFTGLSEGTFAVVFTLPDTTWAYTIPDQGGNDNSDSDALPAMNGMTANFTLGAGEIKRNVDAGIYVRPVKTNMIYCICLDNATNEDNGQFLNGLLIESYPNEIWTIATGSGGYDLSSPEPPADPIPIDILSYGLQEIQMGVYSFDFKSVDGEPFSYVLTNGIDEISISGGCAYPEINLDPVDTTNICASDDPIALNANPSLPGTIGYFIDGSPVTEINPGALGAGSYELSVTFTPVNAQECEAQIILPFTVNDTCFTNVAGRVWLDSDRDGIQDNSEDGLEGVTVIIDELDESGPLFTDTTQTDAQGNYSFEVLPGVYKLTVVYSAKYLLTIMDEGADDNLDSDFDPMTDMTVIFVVPKDQDVTMDAGLVLECENITDAGIIGYDQYLCGPGNLADLILNLESPSGGYGEIEYLWMRSFEPGPFDPQRWEPIPDSNSPEYDPGVLYETTYFARCARRAGCGTYLENNIIKIEVGTEANPTIDGPDVVCVGSTVQFAAPNAGPNAKVSWDFGPTGNPRYPTGTPVSVTLPALGFHNIELTVEEYGCIASMIQRVTVVNTPTYCGTGLVIDLTTNAQEHAILNWEVLDLYRHTYVIERSADSLEFYELDQVTEPKVEIGNSRFYEFVDTKPKRGHNYYRIKLIDQQGSFVYSNTEELILLNDSELVMIYPNPVSEQLTLEIFDDYGAPVSLELININGTRMYQEKLAPETKQTAIDFSGYAPGLYLLKVSYGPADVKILKVLKK